MLCLKGRDGLQITLGAWVGVQRRNKSNLPLERKQSLDNIGFIWTPLKDKT